jgi:hypothetical protein
MYEPSGEQLGHINIKTSRKKITNNIQILTLMAILGHPNTLVDLNLISMGKFQMMPGSECSADVRDICERPVSMPCKEILVCILYI